MIHLLTVQCFTYRQLNPWSRRGSPWRARLVLGQVLIAQQLTPEQQMIFETSTLKHRRALFAKGILRPAMAVAGESEDCSICYEAMDLSLGR